MCERAGLGLGYDACQLMNLRKRQTEKETKQKQTSTLLTSASEIMVTEACNRILSVNLFSVPLRRELERYYETVRIYIREEVGTYPVLLRPEGV